MIPLWLAGLWANPLVRKATLVVGLAVGVFVAYEYAYRSGMHKGNQQGKEEGKASQIEEDKQQYTQLRSDFISKMTEMEQKQKLADARSAAADARAGDATRLVAAMAVQRDQGQKAVQGLPDSGVLRDLTAKLALRDTSDLTPTLYPRELRRADEIVTDYPLLKGQYEKLDSKVAALAEKIDATADKLDLTKKQLDTAMTWNSQLEGLYIKAYNAVPKKGNWFIRVVTFGVKGKPPHLDFPSPLDLAKLKPAT